MNEIQVIAACNGDWAKLQYSLFSQVMLTSIMGKRLHDSRVFCV